MDAAIVRPDALLRRAPDALAEPVGDATLVLDAGRDAYVRLNRTGGWLFERFAEPATPAAVAEMLAAHAGIAGERALADVLAFCEDLTRRGLLGPA